MTKRRQLPELSDFEIRLLRVFAAVAAAGGYSAAEVALNKSKSSISINMASLETRLGVKLCRRGREGFALTSEGEEILGLSRDLFNSLGQFREQASRVASQVVGELAIVVDDNFTLSKEYEFTRIIGEFRVTCPQVFLNLRTTSPDQAVKAVLDGSADIGVSAAPRDVASATIQPLFDERMVLCCADAHPLFLTATDPIEPDILGTYGFVDIVTRQHAQARKTAGTFQVSGRAPTMQSRLLMILSGHYIGYLPETFVDPYVSQGRIRIINPGTMSYINACSIIVRDEVAPSNALTSAARLLKKHLTTTPVLSTPFLTNERSRELVSASANVHSHVVRAAPNRPRNMEYSARSRQLRTVAAP